MSRRRSTRVHPPSRREPTARPTIGEKPAPPNETFPDVAAPSPFPWRDAAIVAAALFVLYAASAPRTVTLEDSGIFIMSSDVAGVSHPPGYPIHSVLGKLFTLLPIGSVAFRVHLLSALFGALSCAVLFWITHTLTATRVIAYAVAFAYGVSREFWAQAIIAEVYSLNAFFFFLTMALALLYARSPDTRTLKGVALLIGLGVSHHWPLYLLSLSGVFAVMWPRRQQARRDFLRAVPFFGVGLLPYAYLALRSHMDPPISFYGPLDSWDRFFFFVLRSGYADVDATTTAGFIDRLRFAGFLGKESIEQSTPLGMGLAVIGAAAQWRRLPKNVAWGLVLAFAGGTVVLLVLLRRDFGYIDQAVFKVYPLVSYGVMALWLGLGLQECARWISERSAPIGRAAPLALGAAVCATSLALHGRGNWRADYTWARDYAETVLGAVAENAIIITTADADIGTIGYLNRVERVRPDVEIYNDKGLVFSNRLFRPPASDRAKTAAFRRLIEGTDRPVYVTGELALGYPMEDYGLFKKVLRTGEPSVVLHPRVLEQCRAIEHEPLPIDMWTVDHRNVLLVECGRLLGPLVYLSRDAKRPPIDDVLAAISGHLYGKIGLLEGLAEHGDPDDLLRWESEAERLIDPERSKRAMGRLLFIRGFVENRKGATADAVQSFRRSVDVFPDPGNGAVLGLLSLYAAQHRSGEYHELRQTMFGGRSVPARVLELDRSVGR